MIRLPSFAVVKKLVSVLKLVTEVNITYLAMVFQTNNRRKVIIFPGYRLRTKATIMTTSVRGPLHVRRPISSFICHF